MTIPFAKHTFPDVYEQVLVGPLFRPFAELLLAESKPAGGERVLDVACGTGIVARMARERVGGTGRVVGVDASPAMLAVARRVAPDVEWREGDAALLPLQAGERFDLVLCHQGLQFFSDRAAAAREMRRALADGGRVGVSTWRPDDELPVLHELRRIAERHVGPVTDRRHAFGEAAPLEALLRAAGFRDVGLSTVSRTVRFADGAVFVRLNALALIGMSAASKGMEEEERDRLVAAIVRDSGDIVRAHTDQNGFTYELSATLATARA